MTVTLPSISQTSTRVSLLCYIFQKFYKYRIVSHSRSGFSNSMEIYGTYGFLATNSRFFLVEFLCFKTSAGAIFTEIKEKKEVTVPSLSLVEISNCEDIALQSLHTAIFRARLRTENTSRDLRPHCHFGSIFSVH